MKKRILPLAFLSVSLFLSSSATVVYAMSKQTEVKDNGEINTGIVSIEILDKNNSSRENLLPGGVYSFANTVKNTGYPCWIRSKVTSDNSLFDVLNPNSYKNISDDWVLKNDGWMYKKTVLKAGEESTPYEGLNIPKNLTKEQSKDGTTNYTVEAIQAQNMTPNFTKDSPWGEVTIKKNEKQGNTTVHEVESKNASFDIQYDDKSKELITNQKQFLASLPLMMPGDTFTNTAKLSNNSDKERKIYFKASQKNNDFLDQMTFVIKADGKEIYSGKMTSEELEKGILVADLKPNEKKNIDFTISVPSSVDNAFSLDKTPVQWQFLTEDADEPQPKPDDQNKPNPPVKPENKGQPQPKEQPKPEPQPALQTPKNTQNGVNTGVWNGVLGISCVGVLAGLAGMMITFKRYKEEKDKQ